MTELDLYKKMYSKVVRDIDKILKEITKVLVSQNCGWKELHDFYEKIHQVLLDAEEIYVSAEDVDEDDGDGLEYINDQGIQTLGDSAKAVFESVCADMAGSEQLAQTFKEKFEEELRKWKEELRESEEGDCEGGGYVYGNSGPDIMYKLLFSESMADAEEFHRRMAEKFEERRRAQEKERQDAENEKADNQEA